MSRLIFITSPSNCGYMLVKLAKEKRGAKTNGFLTFFRAANAEVIVIDEHPPKQDKPLPVVDIAKKINAHAAINKGSECFCAIHDEKRKEEIKSHLRDIEHVAHLQHTPREPLYDKIFSLLGDNADVAAKVDAICSLISNKPVVSRIARIKHRVGHILLPLDIDMQGLIESAKSDLGAFDYFKSIKHRLINSVSAYGDIEKILQTERHSCKNTKRINILLKSGKSIVQKISKISRAIDTKKASSDSLAKLKRFMGILKKDGKSGSNMFHDWFKEIMGAVDKCYGD